MKLPRHAGTWALVVLAAALGVVLAFDRRGPSDDELDARKQNALPAFDRASLTRVAIERPAGRLVVAREATGAGAPADAPYRLVEPRDDRADPMAVERLVAALELATVLRVAGDPKGLGLETPRATAVLTMGRRTVRVRLGGASPRPEGSSYLQVDDGPVVVVGPQLPGELLRPADDLRDRTLVPYLSVELASLEVERPGAAGLRLERLAELRFALPRRGGVAAGRDAMDRVLDGLSDLRAEAFVDERDAAARTAPGTGAVVVTLTPTDRTRGVAVFAVGGPCDASGTRLLFRRAPTPVAACVPAGAVAKLEVDDVALEDRHLFYAHPDELEELLLENGADALELARKGGGFRQRRPHDRDLGRDEAETVSGVLDALLGAEGSLVPSTDVPRDAFGGVERRVRIVFGGEREERLTVGTAGVAGALVRREVDGHVLRVDADVARLLTPWDGLTRSPVLVGSLAAPRAVTSRCDGLEQRLEAQGNELVLRAPAGAELDGATGAALVDFARTGRAVRWVAPRVDPAFGLTPAPCRITFELTDGRTTTLEFGAATARGAYGRIAGEEAVFFVAPATRRLLARPWVSRAPLRPSRDDVVRVVARAAQGPVRDLGRRSDVLDAIVTLFADDVLHLGPARAEEGLATPWLEVRVTERTGSGERTTGVRVGAPLPDEAATSPSGASPSEARAMRVDGVDATFLISAARLAPLLRAVAADAGAGEPPDGGAGLVAPGPAR